MQRKLYKPLSLSIFLTLSSPISLSLPLSLLVYSPHRRQQLISKILQRLSYTTCQSKPSIFQGHYQALNFRLPAAACPCPRCTPTPVLLPHTSNILFSATLAFLYSSALNMWPHEFALPQVESEMCGVWNVESGEPYSSVLLRSTG